MQGKIIRLGNSEEECRQAGERHKKKRFHMRKKLDENGWRPIVDDNEAETGFWNNVMINPLLVLSTRAAYKRALEDEFFLRKNKWNRYSYFSRQCEIFYGWIHQNWGIRSPKSTWRALEITKEKIQLTVSCTTKDKKLKGKN